MNDDQAAKFFEHGVHVKAMTAIMRSPQELYAVWRNLIDLPRFIDHLKSVVRLNDRVSRWTTRGPGGSEFTWDAEIIVDEPGRRLTWKTIEGSAVPSAGTVMMAALPEGRGTRMEVVLEYVPPGRRLGELMGKATGDDARTQVRTALHRFRQVMEAGETAVTEGQPTGSPRRGQQQRQTDADVRDVAALESIT